MTTRPGRDPDGTHPRREHHPTPIPDELDHERNPMTATTDHSAKPDVIHDRPFPPAPALEFVDVVKRFGSGTLQVRALTDVSLRVEPGEFVAVMGPSGCGKSTLLHLAGGLEEPSAGQVLVGGRDVTDMSARDRAEMRRRHVGYVFQDLNLIPALTAMENVMLPLELDGVPTRDARRMAGDALARVGLDHHLDRYPDDFSGGQQQRIAIARAVIGGRRILLADEPTGALDTLNSDQVVEILAAEARDHDTSVVMVTHEPRLASVADRIVFLRDGRVVDQTATSGPIEGGASS